MKEAAKFTPGPWKWWTSNSRRRLKREAERGGPSQSVLEPYVASDGHPDCIVSDADAHLIAAAPDLYASLREMLATYWKDDAQGPWPEPVIRAHAALLKASGALALTTMGSAPSPALRLVSGEPA